MVEKVYCWVSSPGGCHVLSLLDPEFPRQLAPSSLLPVYVLLHLLQSREGTLFNLSKMMMKILKCCQNKIDELTKNSNKIGLKVINRVPALLIFIYDPKRNAVLKRKEIVHILHLKRSKNI